MWQLHFQELSSTSQSSKTLRRKSEISFDYYLFLLGAESEEKGMLQNSITRNRETKKKNRWTLEKGASVCHMLDVGCYRQSKKRKKKIGKEKERKKGRGSTERAERGTGASMGVEWERERERALGLEVHPHSYSYTDCSRRTPEKKYSNRLSPLPLL